MWFADSFQYSNSEITETENDLLGIFIDSVDVPAGWCGVIDLENPCVDSVY